MVNVKIKIIDLGHIVARIELQECGPGKKSWNPRMWRVCADQGPGTSGAYKTRLCEHQELTNMQHQLCVHIAKRASHTHMEMSLPARQQVHRQRSPLVMQTALGLLSAQEQSLLKALACSSSMSFLESLRMSFSTSQ